MKKIVLILLILISLTACTPYKTEFYDIEAEITKVYTGSKMEGKINKTTYKVDLKYNNYTSTVEDSELYDRAIVGQKIKAKLMISKDEQGNIVNYRID